MSDQLVLIDTSAWIDYLRGETGSTADQVSQLISQDRLATCPLIFQELLQGIQNQSEYESTRQMLETIPKLRYDDYKTAIGAADIFRFLRRRGITIRKSNDCLIAWYALESGCAVLHKDRDFDLMAKPLSLKIFR